MPPECIQQGVPLVGYVTGSLPLITSFRRKIAGIHKHDGLIRN
jgi:hypothetical protein